jgi:transposase-like protein
MEKKRAANRKTMEKWRRTQGMAPAAPPLSEEERRKRRLARYRYRMSQNRERPGTCALCGKEGPVERHHPDYSKPRLVTWLCKSCHEDFHHRLRDPA